MTRLPRRIAAALAMLTMMVVGSAHADTRLNGANKSWQAADKCMRSSFTQYPDYTAEAAQKRDRFVQACLRDHRLPPRPDMAPAAPAAAVPQ